MTVYYEVDVTLGPYHWLVKQTDTPDPVDPGPLGGLEFGWALPTQDTYPCQPEPMDAALGVIVSDAADVALLDIGSPVGIKVRFDTSGDWPLEFYGKATDLTGSPHDRGWLVSLIALDYTVDDDHFVAGQTWPQEAADVRLVGIFTAAGITQPTDPWAGGHSALTQPALDVGSESWAPLVVNSLDAILGTDATGDTVRAILAPVIDAGVLTGYALDGVGKTNAQTLPGEFGVTAGGYGILFTLDHDPVEGILDACVVERSAEWVRRKYDAISRLEISGTDDSVITADNGGTPRVTGRLSLDAVSLVDPADSFLDFYLPDAASIDRWAIESLVWRLDKDVNLDTTLTQGWMPVHSEPSGTAVRTLAYRRGVVISNIPSNQNPSGKLYAGQLRSARFSIESRIPRLAFTMRRTLPEPTLDPITPAGIGASSFSAVTVADLDPAFIVYDYRLVKEPV